MIRIGMLLSDRYEVLEKIGSGGMSDVYKAKDVKLNRMVAVKILKQEYCSDRSFVSKFWTEAQSAAGLSHSNIVSIYDVGNDGDTYYIVMELVEGITLKKYIEKKGKLEIRESIGITMQLCQGIEAAHDQKIIHRDIKPQNIMISKDGKVKVADFGIAKAASSQTISSNAMGSVHYISPEQARGGYCDERSDIYSIGIVMYEMLTGVVPFEGDSTVQVALMHIQSEMVPPRKYEPMIPISLEKIILKCTQKKPEARYASVPALMADLRRALMTPDEDFVKIAPVVASDDPTRVMSPEEVEQIKNESRQPVAPIIDQEEEAYLRGYEEEDEELEEDEEADEEDDEEDEESDSKMEKIITGVSIGVAILIVLLAIWIIGRAFGLFSGGSSEDPTVNFTTQAATEEDEKTAEMPDVVGIQASEAEEILNALGLGVMYEYVSAPEMENGVVIHQQYVEGTRVDKHTSVTLTICDNSELAEVPAGIVGSSYEAAYKALNLAQLVVNKIEKYDDEVESGIVISVDPDEGTQLEKSSVVDVVVSMGPEIVYVKVPSVTGYTEAEATSTLENAGLKVTVETKSSEEVAQGYVINQSAASGNSVAEGSTITIVVSAGSSKATVPNLTNMTWDQAKEELEKNNLQLSSSYEEAYSSTVEAGKVMGQSIDSGTSVDKGTTITVTLSKGSETVEVPNVTTGSMTQEAAEAALKNAGLNVSVSSEYNSAASGIVFWQSQSAGNTVKVGTTIEIKVSLGPKPTEATTEATTAAPTEGNADPASENNE
jgi:serine/threonine-protein kinase